MQGTVLMLLGLVAAVCVIAIIFIIILTKYVFSQNTGNEKVQEIAKAIKEGAMAFLSRQYKTIAILAVVVSILLGFVTRTEGMIFNWHTFVSFVFGAICSGIAGYIGMYVAVHANVRAAAGANDSLNKSLNVSFRGGAVTGLSVTTLSLLGVTLLFFIFGGGSNSANVIKMAPELIVGYGFGASFVALFAQLGGGIYTKAADVGADLVGKVEAGIPEDDPRNPAVVADLVGDNVGDCAGRGADLFESTAAENIGAMILGIALFPVFGVNGILFPLLASAAGIIASIVGIFCVKTKEDKDPMAALNRGYVVTTVLCAIFFIPIISNLLGGNMPGMVNKVQWGYFYGCALIGLALSFVFVYIAQYYTATQYRPVKKIAEASQTGPGTNIIAGIAVGLESTFAPVVVICIAIFASYSLGEASGISNIIVGGLKLNGGFYGTAVATLGMLSTCTYILAMDTFGPITDNAGGITEMSGAPDEIRIRTDKLDACGNTTKALTKGYAVGSAALATFLLFSAFVDVVKRAQAENGFNIMSAIDIGKPTVFIGGFIGAMIVFLFSSTAINAVGKAAQYVIVEVRRQFKAFPGIMEGTQKPDYGACVDIVTKGALKEMVVPGIIVVIAPIAVGLLLGAEAAAALLMVGTIVGVLMALFLNNAGGAWDNAKKFIELGSYGGKKSEAHKASVVGDTVGDPFKDTAGPSLHILIKLFSTITLVLASLFVAHGLIK